MRISLMDGDDDEQNQENVVSISVNSDHVKGNNYAEDYLTM